MIQLDDKLIRYFEKLEKEDLIIYIVLRRYITEKSVIDLKKVVKITGYSELRISEILNKLSKLELILIKNSKMIDLLSSETIKLEQADDYYIYLINLYKDNKVNKDIKINKVNSIALPEDSDFITIKFKRVLRKLESKYKQGDIAELVNYFADKLILLYSLKRTPNWRREQFSIAKRLFKEHDLKLKDWQGAIDYFTKQDYWKGKLSSLKQIEKNIAQYIVQARKPESTIQNKVEVIA